MPPLSKRHKILKIAITRELTTATDKDTGLKIGVSTSARIFFRKYFNIPSMKATNDVINETLAHNYAGGELVHRFKLKSGEIADVKKNGSWYLIGVERMDSLDIIALQPSYKEAPDWLKKIRLERYWGKTIH